MIYAIAQAKEVAISELNNYNNKKEAVETSLNSSYQKENKEKVVANTSGYVYFLQNISKGSFLQTGSLICKIIPQNSSNLYAEIYVSNSDIARLYENQDVKIKIGGYSSLEYGDIKGKIEYISKEIRVDEKSGYAYYIVRVSCDNIKSVDSNWDSGHIVNGMMADARIIVGEKNVL